MTHTMKGDTLRKHSSVQALRGKYFSLVLLALAATGPGKLQAGLSIIDDPNAGSGKIQGNDWSISMENTIALGLPGKPTFITPPDRNASLICDSGPLVIGDVISDWESCGGVVFYDMGATDWISPFSYHRRIEGNTSWIRETSPEFYADGELPDGVSFDLLNEAELTMVNDYRRVHFDFGVVHHATPTSEPWTKGWSYDEELVGQNPGINLTMGGTDAGAVYTVGVSDAAAGPVTQMIPVPPITIVYWNNGSTLTFPAQCGSAAGAFKDVRYPPAWAEGGANFSSSGDGSLLFGTANPGSASFAYHDSTHAHVGERYIMWHGPAESLSLPAGIDREVGLVSWDAGAAPQSLADYLSASGYNTSGGNKIGEAVTYAVVPAYPGDVTVANVFQVAMSLGGELCRQSIYDSSSGATTLNAPQATSAAVAGSTVSVSGFLLSGAGSWHVSLKSTLGTLTIQNTSGVTVTGNGTSYVEIDGTASAITSALNTLAYTAGTSAGDDIIVTSVAGGSSLAMRVTSAHINGVPITTSPSSFSTRIDLTVGTGSSPRQSAIADFDGDGKPDLAVVNSGFHSVYLYRNVGTGVLSASSFASPQSIAFGTGSDSPMFIASGDVDGDTKIDLVVADRNNNRVGVLKNTSISGAISFAAPVYFATGGDPRVTLLADLDLDGWPEIITANSASNSVSILRNLHTGGIAFTSRLDIAVGTLPQSVAVGDLDGDGKPDLVVGNCLSSNISLIRNLNSLGTEMSASSFQARVDLPAPYYCLSVAIGDIDGDCRPDVVTGSYLTSKLSVYRNITADVGPLSTNSFAPRVDFGSDGRIHTVVLADFNHDHKLDIVTVTELNSYMSVYQNQSTPGAFTSASLATRKNFSTGTNPWGLEVHDLDGDGWLDCVFGNVGSGTLSLYRKLH